VVHILDGREAHAMLQLLFTQEDCGTAIRKA
jgi:acetylglutamate kinase